MQDKDKYDQMRSESIHPHTQQHFKRPEFDIVIHIHSQTFYDGAVEVMSPSVEKQKHCVSDVALHLVDH